jgi:hypothetical protein
MLNRRDAGWEGERAVKCPYRKTVVFPHRAHTQESPHAPEPEAPSLRAIAWKSQDQQVKRQYFQGSELSTPNFSVRSGTYKSKGEHRWSS